MRPSPEHDVTDVFMFLHHFVFSRLPAGPQLRSDSLDGASPVGDPKAAQNLVQSLAATGLNVLSQSLTGSCRSKR